MKIVIGTHMRDDDLKYLKPIAECLDRIAHNSGVSGPPPNIIILKQPDPDDEGNTVSKRALDKTSWVEEPTKIKLKFNSPLTVIYDSDYIPNEPATLAWNRLHLHAFTHPNEASRFIYVDPDISDIPSEIPEGGLELLNNLEIKLGCLIRESLKFDYIIGDYNPVTLDPTYNDSVGIKIDIEKEIVNMLKARFQSLTSIFDSLGLKRPRSEFHGLSKELYNAAVKDQPIPYDYGLQMLVVANKQRMQVTKIDIGNVPEFKIYNSKTKRMQLRRVDF